MFPKDVRYTQTHEWVRLEGNVATVGITKYAADQLSDLTYVELPGVGDDLVAETALGAVESVKAAADLICPIDGKVLEVNEAAIDNPDMISADPYEDGWLVKMAPTDRAQIDELMTADAYQEFVLTESGDEEEEEEEEVEDEEDGVKKPAVKKRHVDDDFDDDADADFDDDLDLEPGAEVGAESADGDEADEDDEEDEEDSDTL